MASEIKVDTISEKTSANGVTIDGVSLKDSKIATANSVDSDAYVDASIDNAHLADNAVDTAEIADNAVTLAKMDGLARGTLIYGDASGDPAALAAGAANEVLTHDGTDFDWAAASGGAALTGSTDNTVVTVTGADAIQGEALFTFDGTSVKTGSSATSGSDTQAFQVGASRSGANIAVINNATAGTPYGPFFYFGGASPDNNTSYFLRCDDATEEKCTIQSTGDIDNVNNSYGAISDEKLKEQIKDATSQWDDIKNLKVKKFKFKSMVALHGDSDDLWRVGLIAQDVEETSPALVTENPDKTKNETLVTDKDGNPVLDEEGNQVKSFEWEDAGTTTKSLKYSVLYMKAIKALQESMERIEQLEAKVTALENA